MNINHFIYNLSDLEQEYSDEIYEFCNKLFNLNLSLTGDDVKKGKPDPEIYRTIRNFFGIIPKNCFVVEDSESGIKAAKLAKLKNIFKFSKKSVNRLSEGVVNFKNSKTILNFINH